MEEGVEEEVMGKKALIVTSVATMISQFNMGNIDVLQKGGYEVYVGCNFERDNPCSEEEIKKLKNTLKTKGVKIYQIDFSRSIKRINSHFKAYSQLKKITGQEFDIVHCQSPIGGVLTRLAFRKSRRHGTRIIYTAHGFHFYKGAPVYYWLMFYPVEKYLAKYTDTLITINAEDYERAKRKFGKRCRDIQYVPGIGVDEKKFEKKMSAAEKARLRESLGLESGDKVLICVGRLDKNKNQGFLIKAMPELLKKNANCHLLLVGPDEINGKYQKLVSRLGLDNNVHFLGFRDDVDKLLQISDIMVSASKREGLPVNLIEAAFLGMPIVVMDCRGGRDVCEVAGSRTIKQGDYKNYIKQINNIKSLNYNDEVKQYNTDNVMEEISKIYFRKKRVLHVLASNSFSGAENVACTIINNLSDKYDMVYCSPRGAIERRLKEAGIEYVGVKKLNSRNFRKVVVDYNPDIIHAHDYRASVVASSIKGFSGKIISHIHVNAPFAKRWGLKAFVYTLNIKRYNLILGVSDQILKDAIFKKYIIKKYHTLYNYVDVDDVLRRSNSSICQKRYDICFVGRLTLQKNPLAFIDVISKIHDYEPNIKVCMIGDGPMKDVCRKKISELNLANNIEMLGFMDNPFPIVKEVKVCMMPSSWEGFGLTAIEAMILNVPVLNSGAGGLSEVFGENSYYVCKNIEEYVRKFFQINDTDVNLAPIYAKFINKELWKGELVYYYG